MGDSPGELLRDSGRGIVGALLLGMPLLYTMETWWIGGRMPAWHLLGFSLLGLLAVLVLVHYVGFRPKHRGPQGFRQAVSDFTQLVLHAFIASFAVLFLFGVVELDDDPLTILRMGLVQIVPLGFGAAISNQALREGGEEDGEGSLLREMVLFAVGAAFFAFPVSPTEEMSLMATHAGWWRMFAIALASVLVTRLALYELRFRGSRGRTAKPLLQWGETFAGYLVAFTVCALLLWGFGQFGDAPFVVMVQKTVVLSFLGCLGGAAARVVI